MGSRISTRNYSQLATCSRSHCEVSSIPTRSSVLTKRTSTDSDFGLELKKLYDELLPSITVMLYSAKAILRSIL